MRPEKGFPTSKGLLLNKAADILSDLSVDIEALGSELCGDAEVVTRHASLLQSIDLIAQKQRYLATLIRADDPEGEIDDIGLEDLREELSNVFWQDFCAEQRQA